MTVCVDCIDEGITTVRPIVSGTRKPRCATHDRAHRQRQKTLAHGRMVSTGYDIDSGTYWELYVYQGSRCWICRAATGKTRRLSVDHDHKVCDDHAPEHGCPNCIRGLLCRRCNQLVAWYGVESLSRAVQYLLNPPAKRFFETRIAKEQYL